MTAPPSPPPGPYRPVAVRRGPDIGIVIIVVGVALFVLFGIIMMSIAGGTFGPFGFGAAGFFFCIPFLFVILVAGLGLYKALSGGRTIPPPPPIQQPMVPAGRQGPVTLDCPNCGGPPSNVDRFGIAVCSYCGTRYLVR